MRTARLGMSSIAEYVSHMPDELMMKLLMRTLPPMSSIEETEQRMTYEMWVKKLMTDAARIHAAQPIPQLPPPDQIVDIEIVESQPAGYAGKRAEELPAAPKQPDYSI